MVIDNFDIMGMPIGPNKTHTPLAVNADAVLTQSVALQGFKLVSRRNAQELQHYSRMQLLQLAHRYRFKIYEPGHTLSAKQGSGIAALETLNHVEIITSSVISVKWILFAIKIIAACARSTVYACK
jgi:hypothetical protein